MKTTWQPPANATTYPRPSGDWTVAHHDGGYASLSPETGRISSVEPAEDKKLPALGQALRDGSLLSYRIGRRAVVATSNGFIKVVRPSRLEAISEAHDGAWRAGAPVPEVLETSPLGTIELAAVDGASLHQTLGEGTAEHDVFACIAESLANFHSRIETKPLPEKQPDSPQRWVDIVGRVDPAAANALAELAAALPTIPHQTTTAVHGDLHDKNIFVGSSGVRFIDLDGLGCGGAEIDLGNLAAHLQLRAMQRGGGMDEALANCQALYGTYAALLPVDPEILHSVEQHTWFRLGCLYQLRGRDQGSASFLSRIER